MKKLPLLMALLGAVTAVVVSQAVVFGQSPTPTPTPAPTLPATPTPTPIPVPTPFLSKIEFKGVVKEISPTQWTVSGLKVQVTPLTKIKGSPAVGDVVKVEGTLAEDGTILAKEIKAMKAKGKKNEEPGHISRGKGKGHDKHDHDQVGHRHEDDD